MPARATPAQVAAFALPFVVALPAPREPAPTFDAAIRQSTGIVAPRRRRAASGVGRALFAVAVLVGATLTQARSAPADWMPLIPVAPAAVPAHDPPAPSPLTLPSAPTHERAASELRRPTARDHHRIGRSRRARSTPTVAAGRVVDPFATR
jgi:hypothetical protein